VMNVGAYWFSDKIVLKAYRAVELPEADFPDIYRMVRQLTEKANIPMPKLYYLNQESPNAFATGRNPENSAIALSKGMINLMKREELEGVIAHELTHIINRDTLISTVAATISGAIMFLAYQMRWFAILGGGRDDDDNGGVLGLILMAILAPLAATIIQMAISRSREYKADSGGAHLTNNPEGLASGLQKLGQLSKRIPMKATKQTAHMFIVNPFSGKSLFKLFSTHPPIEERVARLRAMAL
ncbi:MAG: zinc metalloprotease HtpX, partial [Candidatus Aminicenantes bacterium]|nr:zinc metalloprotease HtpX [Candidatus Aminicenantes bacterium]